MKTQRIDDQKLFSIFAASGVALRDACWFQRIRRRGVKSQGENLRLSNILWQVQKFLHAQATSMV